MIQQEAGGRGKRSQGNDPCSLLWSEAEHGSDSPQQPSVVLVLLGRIPI